MRRNVGQLMTADPVKVRMSTPFKEMVRLMREHGISGLPVVDEVGTLVGVVSEGDLILKETREQEAVGPLFESRRHRVHRLKAAGAVAADLMTSPVLSIGPLAASGEAARLMTDRGVKRLPVVDGGGRLVGVISRSDLLDVFLRDDGEIRQEIVERAVMPELRAEHPDVRVDVRDGVVTLAGTVKTRSTARSVADAAERVEGVVRVIDLLEWKVDDLARVEAFTGPAGIPRW
jgi:CBS domain-containing protein